MRPMNEMTPWHAVTLWAKEELEKLGYRVRIGHKSTGKDTWYVTVKELNLEIRCDGEDFRMCKTAPGTRYTTDIYEYADPNCFDVCLANLVQYDLEHKKRLQRQRRQLWQR